MKKAVTFGETMLRLAPPLNQRLSQARSFDAIYGGAELNVAVSLANYGVQTEYVTRLPDNPLGIACRNYMRQFGVGTHHVIWGGDRLGIYFLETGAAQRGSKVVYDRANSSLGTIEPGTLDWHAIFADAGWLHWTGITPALSESAAATCLEAVRAASERGVSISYDLNYRELLWQWGKSASEVMPELVSLCNVAIGNEYYAERVFGIQAPKAGTDRFAYVCEKLVARFPNLRLVADTQRASLSASHNRWSARMWADGELYTSREYDITNIVDRVGAGDAFSGSLIYGLETFDDYQQTLDFAVAASCLKHSIPGDFNLVSLEEVKNLMSGDASGRVSR